MAWDPSPTLRDRFAAVWTCLTAMFPSRRRAGRTYRGFSKALTIFGPQLLDAVHAHLRSAVASLAHPLREGWLAFAVDGSKIDCPRTAANEAAFGLGSRAGSWPQMWLVTLWHMGTGLPWAWRLGDARASERHLLRQMLHLLPELALLVMDAGYTGYDLLKTIHQSQRFFLVRVGANITLLRELGYWSCQRDDTVYLWRNDRRQEPPLVLRLIKVKAKGKTMYLVTNVLDSPKLSKATAGKLYRLRWGVEVFFRSFKQTLQRRKMRSTSPKAAEAELQWSLVGLLLLGLLHVRMLIARGHDALDGSVAGALRVMREAIREAARPRTGLRALLARLGQALKDRYRRRRSKQARDWPHKKNQQPPGSPKIRRATPSEVRKAQQLPEETATE
jgi:hypothetical protein